MARKVSLGNLKMNPTPPAEDNHLPEVVIHSEDKINETIQLLLNTNNKILNYNIKQASQTLGISEEFLRRRIAAGKIKTINFGDKKMITIFEIARILNTGVE